MEKQRQTLKEPCLIPDEYCPVAMDWCAAFDEHPFTMTLSVNSSICLGCVRCHVTGRQKVIPMCSGSKTAGKTEQGEWNWIRPGGHLEPTFLWILGRTIRDGGVSFPRTGETYPGFDLCKLCGFVAFEATARQA